MNMQFYVANYELDSSYNVQLKFKNKPRRYLNSQISSGFVLERRL